MASSSVTGTLLLLVPREVPGTQRFMTSVVVELRKHVTVDRSFRADEIGAGAFIVGLPGLLIDLLELLPKSRFDLFPHLDIALDLVRKLFMIGLEHKNPLF